MSYTPVTTFIFPLHTHTASVIVIIHKLFQQSSVYYANKFCFIISTATINSFLGVVLAVPRPRRTQKPNWTKQSVWIKLPLLYGFQDL